MWLVKSLLLIDDVGSLNDFLGTPVCVWVCIEKIQGEPWVHLQAQWMRRKMKVACWEVHPDTWIHKHLHPPASHPCVPSSAEFTLNLGYSPHTRQCSKTKQARHGHPRILGWNQASGHHIRREVFLSVACSYRYVHLKACLGNWASPGHRGTHWKLRPKIKTEEEEVPQLLRWIP